MSRSISVTKAVNMERVVTAILGRARYRVQIWVFGVQIYSNFTHTTVFVNRAKP